MRESTRCARWKRRQCLGRGRGRKARTENGRASLDDAAPGGITFSRNEMGRAKVTPLVVYSGTIASTTKRVRRQKYRSRARTYFGFPRLVLSNGGAAVSIDDQSAEIMDTYSAEIRGGVCTANTFPKRVVTRSASRYWAIEIRNLKTRSSRWTGIRINHHDAP
jgi:hypothetical protein